MPYPTRKDAISNLEKLQVGIGALSVELYDEVKVALRELIDSDITFTAALKDLDKIFAEAALNVSFSTKFYDEVLRTIALSSFSESLSLDNLGAMTFDEFEPKIAKILAKGKEKTVNQAIRGRATQALEEQRVIINNALRTGRTIRQTAKELQVVQEKFGRIKKIAKAEEIPQTVINKRIFKRVSEARAQIANYGYADTSKKIDDIEAYLKKTLRQFKDGQAVNPSLRGAYRDLLKAIETDKALTGGARDRRLSRIDRAIERAMKAKAEQHAMAVAQTESLNNVAEAKIIKALQNPDTQYIASITSGSNPCPYCLMVEDIGWQQINQALNPTFHTHCSCSVKFKRTLGRPERLSDKEYESNLSSHIQAATEKRGKIYVDKVWKGVLPKPVDLRKAKFYTDYVNEV
jgi:hypothetical protein